MYVGHTLLGFSTKEVGRLTFREWKQQYEHYKSDYDFRLAKVSYQQLEDEAAKQDEWIPDTTA